MLENAIRGYHEYTGLWDSAVNGVGLTCEKDPGHSHDTFAVGMTVKIGGC